MIGTDLQKSAEATNVSDSRLRLIAASGLAGALKDATPAEVIDVEREEAE